MSDKLTEWLASVSDDPYAFVLGAFPWGEPDTRLATERGPEPWQEALLQRLRDRLISVDEAIREATGSGHGVGKSACVSWIILWAVSTLPDTRGVVTANTETQLKTKTWAELGKWYHLFIAKDLFSLTATALISIDPAHERTWRIDMIPWSERNSEAFAGLHNKGRRLLLIFDEASNIPDVIWETAEGALTDADTEIIWCVFGNPTRNTGRFKECFHGGRFAHMWNTTQVDSREVSFTNKKDIQAKIDAYGDDSDYVRIRILGQFPRVGEMEFFSAADVQAAMEREAEPQRYDPLALGVDVARYGQNQSVIFPRKGRDARSIPRERFQGINTVQLAVKVSETSTALHANGIFVDGGGVGGGVVDNLRNMRFHCFDVQFGGKADLGSRVYGDSGERYANKRAEMYGSLRGWIKGGAIPNEPEIREQLLGITYTFNKRDEIILTSKEDMMKDGKPSPDDADALALTFAYALPAIQDEGSPNEPLVQHEYDPFAKERMVA